MDFKGRITSALLSIFMMLVSNTLRADNVISQFHILGGELSYSAVTSVVDIEEVLPRMKTLRLNTVLVPVYWEFLEPVEGQIDFLRRHNDDQSHQGRHARISVGEWKILHIQLYEYQ